MVWRKACTGPANCEELDFTAWGDGGIQHWILDYPARNRLDYCVRIDKSVVPKVGSFTWHYYALNISARYQKYDSSYPGQQEWLRWSLEAPSSLILLCLAIVIFFCPFCAIKIMTILLIAVHLKLLNISPCCIIWTALKSSLWWSEICQHTSRTWWLCSDLGCICAAEKTCKIFIGSPYVEEYCYALQTDCSPEE